MSPSPKTVTYCSFACDDPSNSCVVILEGAYTPDEASRRAWRLHLNPGGELLAEPIKEDDPDVSSWLFDTMWANRHRRLSHDEARKLFDCVPLKASQLESDE